MIFRSTPLAGVVVVEPEPVRDARGFFARTWCVEEFERNGLVGRFEQSSTSYNARRHTVRGLHYQIAPSREAKLVRVVAGAIFDVMVDLRPDSATLGATYTLELNAADGVSVYIPPQVAHGFQTLDDETTVLYCMTQAYDAQWSRTLHWRSPGLAIHWPQTQGVVISDADCDAAPYEPDRALGGDRSGDRPR